MMKWLRTLTGCFTAAVALFAGGLALSIYFSYSGNGQMYTAENVGAKLQILLIPLLIWLVLLVVAAVFEMRTPIKPVFAAKPVYPGMPAWVRPVAIGVAAAAGIWMVVYLVNPAHFSSRELESIIRALVIHIVPAAAVMLVCAYFMQKQVDPRPVKPNAKAVLLARVVLGVLAVVFIVIGVMNGGVKDVFVKAINICTECVGLG